ncbi:MAG: hypothetical protein NZ772_02735 [Cyanobacteria bacterium]|nr:hypothetical protein [Cyanobacteriota bacterium]
MKSESPEEMLERFQNLFTDSVNYPDPHIRTALHQLAVSEFADDRFRLVFNRCCYILINNWRQPNLQWAVQELLAILADFSSESYGTSAHRLHKLLCQFTQSEEYGRLQQLAQGSSRGERVGMRFSVPATEPNLLTIHYIQSGFDETSESEASQPLRTLVHRYPFLYDHCLANRCRTIEERDVVHRQKLDTQRTLASNLRDFYHVYIVNSHRQGSAHNPTSLDDEELRRSLLHFTGKVHHGLTYRQAACDFLKRCETAPDFREFKADFYDYLKVAVEPYGNGRFHEKLRDCIHRSCAQHNTHSFSRFLPDVCQDVLKFLVFDKNNLQGSIVTFTDVFNNSGATSLVGLLLKIALLCKQAKEFLERQIAYLFNHHKTSPRKDVKWLEQSLDHLNVAFCTHYYSSDFLT